MTDWADVADEEAFRRLVLSAGHPAVVAFETGSCGHCRDSRALLTLAWRHLDWPVVTARVDAARLPGLADRYRIVGYPTIVVFFHGHVVDRLPGRRDPHAVTRRLAHLAQPVTRAGPDAGQCCA